MKMNTRDFQRLLDEESESEEFERMFDREKVNEKITKLLAKEKHADDAVYKSHDSKRKFKNR